MCFLRIFLKLCSGVVRFLKFSRASKLAKAKFDLSIAIDSLEMLLLQRFRSDLRGLNFLQIIVAAFEGFTGLDQTEPIGSRNPGCSVQYGSNLNFLLRGMEVSMVTTHRI